MGPLVLAKAFLRLLLHKSSFFALLLVFSSSPLACNGLVTRNIYKPRQLNALQAVWGAWNKSTPEPAKNLAGWNSSQRYPCSQDSSSQQESYPNWRGVECLRHFDCTEYYSNLRNCDSYITGLTLDKASIVGFLPPEIGNISTLTTIELTGNPRLTGTLPDTLESIPNLYNLDLHDNGFSGRIPDFQNLRNVNLMGNRFRSSGTFPLPTTRRKDLVQTFNLGSNDLDGLIPEDTFQNLTQLVQLDLSHNRFSGPAPNLSYVTSLEVLNLSGNAFTGSAHGLWNSLDLQELDLSYNRFYGAPPNLSSVPNLEVLDLSYNNFSGTLPDLTSLTAFAL